MIFKIVNPNTLLIEHSYIAEEQVSYGGPWGEYSHIAVPESLDSDCVKASLIDNVITLIEDSDKVAAKVLANKNARILVRINLMLSDIAAGMYNCFGTYTETSAITFHMQYQDMVSNPSYWVGEMFADEAAVLAYATPKLAASIAFGLVRMARISQYQAEVAAILAE
jgi:hypothetical protein